MKANQETRAYQLQLHRYYYCRYPVWKYYQQEKGWSKTKATKKLEGWLSSELAIDPSKLKPGVIDTDTARRAADRLLALLKGNKELNRFSRDLEYPGIWPNNPLPQPLPQGGEE